MEINTSFNIDEVFYDVSGDDVVNVFVINNIIMSAVGHKIIYEMKDVGDGELLQFSEAELNGHLSKGNLVRTIDEVREALSRSVEKNIEKAENLRKKFMKTKLDRALHGKQKKAETSVRHMKKRLGIKDSDSSESEDNKQLTYVDLMKIVKQNRGWRKAYTVKP